MAALDTFLARLLPRAMGCADPVARQALIDATIEFCEETHAVQVVCDPVTVTINVPNYTPVLPAGQAVVNITKAWYGATPLNPVADEAIRNALAYYVQVGDTLAAKGAPQEYFWHEEQLWVYPIPDATKLLGLTMRVAVKPKHDATAIPEELLINWREAIVDGGLSRTLGMRGTVHYDPVESSKAETRFRHAISRAKATARTGRSGGELSVRMRPFV